MANSIVTIRPTTELEAINVMLGAIGEAPITASPDTLVASDTNIEAAVNILKETVREVLTAGWRFNLLTGFELEASTTYAWLDTAGATTTLNIFKKPADWLDWKQTRCSQMLGLDLIERRSIKYVETALPVMVFFDRVKNRDGAEATSYPHLYMDVVFATDFIDMPECARRYATIVAAKRLAKRVPVSQVQVAFTEDDEKAALRVLKIEQGQDTDLNLFDTVDAHNILGRRRHGGGGAYKVVFPGGD